MENHRVRFTTAPPARLGYIRFDENGAHPEAGRGGVTAPKGALSIVNTHLGFIHNDTLEQLSLTRDGCVETAVNTLVAMGMPVVMANLLIVDALLSNRRDGHSAWFDVEFEDTAEQGGERRCTNFAWRENP